MSVSPDARAAHCGKEVPKRYGSARVLGWVKNDVARSSGEDGLGGHTRERRGVRTLRAGNVFGDKSPSGGRSGGNRACKGRGCV